jgi:hypothetical protein
MISLKTFGAVGFSCAIALLTVSVSAQWPTDPDSNLIISDQSGAQTIPKIAVTSDGGYYSTWYSNASGNYDMYMQCADSAGVLRWNQNGLRISNHPQDTWLTDYDLTVDNQNNAIVVFNDIRTGGDWDIYAYKISPEGNFLWGADGLAISNNAVAEYDPKVAVTTAGNVVVSWQADDTVCLRKVNTTGQDIWNPAIKKFQSEFGLSFPRITPSNNDGVILLYLMALAGGWWPPKNLYVVKFDSAGNSVWPNDTVAVSNAGGLGPQMRPVISHDGSGGAYCYWYDSRDNNLHAYAQHIKSDGSAAWQTDGVLLSSAFARLQGPPSLVRMATSTDVLIFFPVSNMNQDHDGITGQRIDTLGNCVWGSEGIELVPLGSPSLSAIAALPQSDGAIVTYKQSPDDVNNCLVKAIKVDGDGQPLWPVSPTILSSFLSPKGYLASDINLREQVIVVWQDSRNDANGDIYMQNVNTDGSLGPISVDIDNGSATMPANFSLKQNYPNPFNTSTIISYALPRPANVTISIFDILGRQIARLNRKNEPAGNHQIIWDGMDCSSGIYFYKISTGDYTKTLMMSLAK